MNYKRTMYSIEDIYRQALQDDTLYMERNNNVSMINMGIKIQKFPSKTEILNCSRNGDYFQELTPDEYNTFFTYGWVVGCVKMAVNNCIRKLSMIQKSMQKEVNTRRNDKYIKNLKTKREFVMNRYSYHTKKLIKLNNKNGKLF
jgi:hypothetical protein|tara:strand:+ start:500 stop:931 length:432 start_codon:yes stop_codon:yes gene_type:complete